MSVTSSYKKSFIQIDERQKFAFVELQSEVKCFICEEYLQDPFTTDCEHHFCRACIHEELLRDSICPKCQLPLFPRNVRRNPVLCNIMSAFHSLEKSFQELLDIEKSQSESMDSQRSGNGNVDRSFGKYKTIETQNNISASSSTNADETESTQPRMSSKANSSNYSLQETNRTSATASLPPASESEFEPSIVNTVNVVENKKRLTFADDADRDHDRQHTPTKRGKVSPVKWNTPSSSRSSITKMNPPKFGYDDGQESDSDSLDSDLPTQATPNTQKIAQWERELRIHKRRAAGLSDEKLESIEASGPSTLRFESENDGDDSNYNNINRSKNDLEESCKEKSTQEMMKIADEEPTQDASTFALRNRMIVSSGSKNKILLSGFTVEKKTNLVKIIKDLHGVLLGNNDNFAEVTHIVMSNPCRVTFKYFFGIAKGCYIVNDQWLIDSSIKKDFVAVNKSHLIEASGKFSFIKSHLNNLSSSSFMKEDLESRSDLFKGTLFILGPFAEADKLKTLNKEQIQLLLNTLGGNNVIDMEEALLSSKKLGNKKRVMIIGHAIDKKHKTERTSEGKLRLLCPYCSKFEKDAQKLEVDAVVDSIWVGASICNNKMLPYDEFEYVMSSL